MENVWKPTNELRFVSRLILVSQNPDIGRDCKILQQKWMFYEYGDTERPVISEWRDVPEEAV